MPVLPKSSTHANQSSKFLVLAWSPQFYRVASPTSFGTWCIVIFFVLQVTQTSKVGKPTIKHHTQLWPFWNFFDGCHTYKGNWPEQQLHVRGILQKPIRSPPEPICLPIVAKSNTTTICMPYNMYASAKKDFRNSCVPLVSEMKATVRKRIEVTHEGSWLRPNPWGLIFHLLHDVSAVSFPS